MSHVTSLVINIREERASIVTIALLGLRVTVGYRKGSRSLVGEVTKGRVNEVLREWEKAETNDPPRSSPVGGAGVKGL